ncbi:MAG: GGDEF domain-containing protein [Eubacteriales bacterium]|nr:GGDEF domain-containing protein [Eubacteriales bacterium]
MKRKRKKMLLFLGVCFLLLGGVTVQAKTERTIRVGFPLQRGMTWKQEDGSYVGYTVDYLNELSRYTDWDYEYVEVDGDLSVQTAKLMNMLREGEIDLMGAMNSTAQLREEYLFPSYSYGTSYAVIAVPRESDSWMEEDYENWDGIRLAVYPGVEKHLRFLREFASINGFTFTTVKCINSQEMLRAVENGKADAILQADISMEESFRSIARFYPSPFYFAVSKKSPEILRELNQGHYSLLKTCPELQTTLYDRYFSQKGLFHMSKSSREYVEGLGTLKVLFFQGNAPMQGADGGTAEGVAGSFFEKLCQETGLEYQPVAAGDYQSGLAMIQEGEVDLVAAVPFDGLLPQDGELSLSYPYFESYGIVVTNGLVMGEVDPERLYLSVNIESAMKKMESDRVKARPRVGFMDANCVSFYIRKKGLYDKLDFNWGSSRPIRYSVGAADERYGRLLHIINSYTNSMTEDGRQEMLYLNAHDPVEYSFGELVRAYEGWIAGAAVVLVVLWYVYVMYARDRELKQKALESERVYQFSRMTDECLFEYDFRSDRIEVQNSKVFFPGETVIGDFGKRCREAGPEEESCRLQRALYDMLKVQGEYKDILTQKGGVDCWYRIQIKYIGEKGEYAVGRISNVDAEVQTRKNLERQTKTDPMTGLYNRAAAEMLVTRYLQDPESEGILLLLDIDNFKNVNDTYGHISGDQLIQEFGAMLRKCFRQVDLKARLGGDEFVVFLIGDMPVDRLQAKLRKIIQRMNQEVFAKYPGCSLSVSIGAAFSGEKAGDYKSLYRLADNAMYVAKFGGKNDFFITRDEVCMKKGCDNCRKECRRRDYLLKRGILQYDSKEPGRLLVVDPHNNAGKRSPVKEPSKA